MELDAGQYHIEVSKEGYEMVQQWITVVEDEEVEVHIDLNALSRVETTSGKGWLGVVANDLTPEIAQAFGIKRKSGVFISDIMDEGPAEEAGLEPGDIVTRVNGKKVRKALAFIQKVAAIAPGKWVKLEIIRDGKTKTVRAKVSPMPSDQEIASTFTTPPNGQVPTGNLGTQGMITNATVTLSGTARDMATGVMDTVSMTITTTDGRSIRVQGAMGSARLFGRFDGFGQLSNCQGQGQYCYTTQGTLYLGDDGSGFPSNTQTGFSMNIAIASNFVRTAYVTGMITVYMDSNYDGIPDYPMTYPPAQGMMELMVTNLSTN
jgi:membrane-associated protease RseP (regulator of RpoE activity)